MLNCELVNQSLGYDDRTRPIYRRKADPLDSS